MAPGRKTGGRQAGTANKVTTAFKTAVQIVYEDIGGHKAFADWARENPGDFYRIASRLIPTEIASTQEDRHITITIGSVEIPERNVIEQTPALKLIER
jgi:hypothetical protein